MGRQTAGAVTCSAQYSLLCEHGEFELVAAIIDQARQDIEYSRRPRLKRFKNGHANARVVHAQQATAWLNERPTPTAGEWSFPWCCEVLGLDPLRVRTEILSAPAKPTNRGGGGPRGRCRKRS